MKEHKLVTETRPCKDCACSKKDLTANILLICQKKLMSVTPDMLMSYYEDNGTCFQLKTKSQS